MSTPVVRPVYKALHTPLKILGVDRRLFFLALMSGAVAFNVLYSFVAGLLLFTAVYGLALATRHDPQFLPILLRSARSRPRYDPAKHAITTVRLC